MKMKLKNILVFLILLVSGTGVSIAQNYIAVAKNGNVYDEANAKYITVNQNNEDVNVIPGMVFASSQHTPGWYKVEYSPGLHAFIPEQIVATNFTSVSPGSYDIKNNPGQKLKVEGNDDNWTGTINGNSYKGIKFEDILIFVDNNNNQVFSLVDLGNGPIAVTYDNSVTNFF